eukprot:7396880-Lingulodinium_polyedra.AAC.1
MLGGQAWNGMRSGKSDFPAGRPFRAPCAFLEACPAPAAGMAAQRGAARGRPPVQPLSSRAPPVRASAL